MSNIDIEKEYGKLSGDIINLIIKYDNMIYEDKINDKKYLILNEIIEKLEGINSSLKQYFITEKKIYGGIDIIRYFYSENFIKESIDLSHKDWIIFRERKVKKNFLLRAKYCWIIWCLGNRDYHYLEKCARYCNYTLLIYFFNNWNEFFAKKLIYESIGKAFDCYNILKRREEIERLINFSLILCEKLIDPEYSFVIHNIIKICAPFLQHYDKKYTKQFIDLLEREYQIQRKKIPSTVAENTLNLMIKIQSDEDKKTELIKRKAEFYIEVAEIREPPAKYHFYETAARIYQGISEHNLKKKCLKMMENIHLENFLIPIGINVDLTDTYNEYKEIAKEFGEKNLPLDKMIEYIIFPSYEQLQKIPKNTKSIKDLFPTVLLSGGHVIAKLKTEAEKEKERVYQYYHSYLNTYLSIKSHFYRLLIKNGIFDIDNVIILFKKKKVSDNRLIFLFKGLRFYLNNQIIASYHILIPQIEGLLRDIIELNDEIPKTKTTKQGVQDRILGELLNDEEVIDLIGFDIAKYMFWFLADRAGLNIRNKMAHGLMKPTEFNIPILIGIIEIILLLVFKKDLLISKMKE